jgi:hypothetical protein
MEASDMSCASSVLVMVWLLHIKLWTVGQWDVVIGVRHEAPIVLETLSPRWFPNL